MDAARPARVSSSKLTLGWWGLGSMSERGTSSSSVPPPPVSSVGISAPKPLPNPLRRATADLLGKLPIGDGPPGRGIEHDDGLPERGRLGEAHRAGDDVAAHLGAEVPPDLGDHLFGQ